MKFVTFGKEHLEEAKRIAWENYLEERVFVPALPEDIKLWDLNYFAKNGLGVAALNQGKLAGFLCWFSPWSGAFDTKNSLGTFSPLHANGAIKKIDTESIRICMKKFPNDLLIKMYKFLD